MFALGAILFGTTVLIPEYLQTVMGYTAENAGMALSPGGFTVMLLHADRGPARFARRCPRCSSPSGFVVLPLALFHMASIYPGIDFHTAMFYRVYQSIGLAFLFVPINTISFVNIPPSQGNQVSAMINLFRNLGGSVGISALSTLLARRAQVHQTYLAAHTSSARLHRPPRWERKGDALQRRLRAAGCRRAGQRPALPQSPAAGTGAGLRRCDPHLRVCCVSRCLWSSSPAGTAPAATAMAH